MEDALCHPYLEGLHIPDDEPSRARINPLEFEFEKHSLNRHQLKGTYLTYQQLTHPPPIDLIYEEILLYHFPDRLKWHNAQMKNGKGTLQGVLTSEHNLEIYDDNPEDYDEFGL